MSACYWIRDRELGRVHIPGCMGAAVYGPRGCTCGVKRRRQAIEERLARLERRLDEIEKSPVRGG